MEDNSSSFVKSIKALFVSATQYFGEIKTLAALELELAKKSLILMLMLIPILVLLILAVWLLICAGLIALLVTFKISVLYSILIVVGFNILVLMLLIFYILSLKNNLTFRATRKHLKLGKDHGKKRRTTKTKRA